MGYYDELIANAFDKRAALAATFYAWNKDAERTARHYARTVGVSVSEARVSVYRAVTGRPLIGVDRMDEGTLRTRLEIHFMDNEHGCAFGIVPCPQCAEERQ